MTSKSDIDLQIKSMRILGIDEGRINRILQCADKDKIFKELLDCEMTYLTAEKLIQNNKNIDCAYYDLELGCVFKMKCKCEKYMHIDELSKEGEV